MHGAEALDLLCRPAHIRKPAPDSLLELTQPFVAGNYLLARLRLRLRQCRSLTRCDYTLITAVAHLALALA